MEEEAREAEKMRVEMSANIELKDELIGQLEEERQRARKEAEHAKGQQSVMVEKLASLETKNAKLSVENDMFQKKIESA